MAGSAGGTLKLWDLEQQKGVHTSECSGCDGLGAVVRNMVGHRCNCISLDFHPYGDFFASGSSDTNLKVTMLSSTLPALIELVLRFGTSDVRVVLAHTKATLEL